MPVCGPCCQLTPKRIVRFVLGRGRDLVCALLQTDESRRLGLLAGGVRDIKAHAFYAGLDWAALSSLALTPPFKPNEHEWGQATTSPSDSKRITAVRAPAPRRTRALRPRCQQRSSGVLTCRLHIPPSRRSCAPRWSTTRRCRWRSKTSSRGGDLGAARLGCGR
jgi:hypothetical protein